MVDYGQPAAQFEEADVLAEGKAFIGKKITVKGVLKKVDLSDPESIWLVLSNGTRCHFEDREAMAKSYRVGEEIYVDGILKSCEKGSVLIDPAIGRDPRAPFKPFE